MATLDFRAKALDGDDDSGALWLFSMDLHLPVVTGLLLSFALGDHGMVPPELVQRNEASLPTPWLTSCNNGRYCRKSAGDGVFPCLTGMAA
jgi:hypothetical protein